MGTGFKLHTSHFNCISIAATSKKHQDLVMSAKSRINSRLHPFVVNERARLKSRDHLKAVDALTEGAGIPDTLKHHSGFHQVYGWLLTKERHMDRLSMLKADVDTQLPRHCLEYKKLRDKNRVKAMSAAQRKLYFKQLQDEREDREHHRLWKRRQNSRPMSAPPSQSSQLLSPMRFLRKQNDLSVSGLRDAKVRGVGSDDEDGNFGGDYVSRRKDQARRDRVRRRVREKSDASEATRRSARRPFSNSGFNRSTESLDVISAVEGIMNGGVFRAPVESHSRFGSARWKDDDRGSTLRSRATATSSAKSTKAIWRDHQGSRDYRYKSDGRDDTMLYL